VLGVFTLGGAYLTNDITNVYFPSLPAGYRTAPTFVNGDLTVGGTTFQNNPVSVQALQNTDLVQWPQPPIRGGAAIWPLPGNTRRSGDAGRSADPKRTMANPG
jgi:hypothetical protein